MDSAREKTKSSRTKYVPTINFLERNVITSGSMIIVTRVLFIVNSCTDDVILVDHTYTRAPKACVCDQRPQTSDCHQIPDMVSTKIFLPEAGMRYWWQATLREGTVSALLRV